MTVPCSDGLEKADGRHIADGERIEEVVEIVLMICSAIVRGADRL